MDSEADTPAFSRQLAALKRRGSTLLVVGQAGEATALHACQRLLGTGGPPPRRRLVVTTDAEPSLDRRLPDGHDPSRVTVVDGRARTRRASAASSAATEHRVLERAVAEAVDDHADGGLAPAELRLCLDSLRPLLAADECRSRTLLDQFADLAVDHRAIGHVHLPVPYDHRIVDQLSSHVDAVVELRDGDPSEQRWHLQSGATTGWLPL